MKRILIVMNLFFISHLLLAQGYKVGDEAKAFNLKNVDGKMVSSDSFKNAKGLIVVFTCNECPFAVAYLDRIIELNKKYKDKGFPVVTINPNDPSVEPADSFDKMVAKANDKKLTFPYLYDPGRTVSSAFGATNTPHVYLLSMKDSKLTVEYIGAIDDNAMDASKVTKNFLSDAVDALLAGKKPVVSSTKAIGCGVKKRA